MVEADMRITNRFISAGFRLLYLAGAVYGVLLSLFAPGMEMPSALSFYTMQSNLVCVVMTLVLLSCNLADIEYHKNRVYTVLRFCTIVCIFLTFILYHAVLHPRMAAAYPEYFSRFSLTDVLLNTYTPLMMLADYLLFDEKGQFRWWYAPVSAIIPLLYIGYIAIYTALEGRFVSYDIARRVPYYFLDYQAMGTGKALLWGTLITAGTIVGALLLWALDHALCRLWEAYQARPARDRDPV